MAKSPPRLQPLMERLSQVDLNEIDFKNAGSWPRAGKITAWSLILLVTLLLGYLLYIAPKLDTLSSSSNNEQQLLQSYEIKAFQAANLSAYQQQMTTIHQRIDQLNSQLPSERAIPGLIEAIGRQAQAHRVEIKSLKLLTEETHDAYNSQPLTLTIQGYYHNIGRFLAGLTQLERIITLHDFSLTSKGQQLELRIDARAYYNLPTGDDRREAEDE